MSTKDEARLPKKVNTKDHFPFQWFLVGIECSSASKLHRYRYPHLISFAHRPEEVVRSPGCRYPLQHVHPRLRDRALCCGGRSRGARSRFLSPAADNVWGQPFAQPWGRPANRSWRGLRRRRAGSVCGGLRRCRRRWRGTESQLGRRPQAQRCAGR